MTRPIRVLHVLPTMDCGGIETWLMNLLEQSSPKQIQFDFLVQQDREYFYSKKVKDYGSRIISCAPISEAVNYANGFVDAIRRHGPYDVVHCHQPPIQGLVVFLSWICGVPVRIAHIHTAADFDNSAYKWLHRLSRFLLWNFASFGFGTSSEALENMIGRGWKSTPRFQVFHSAVTLKPYDDRLRQNARSELEVDDTTILLGHIGRFSEVKNHRFIVEIADELINKKPSAEFVLVGSGHTKPLIEEEVEKRGLKDYFHFVGIRKDVGRLLAGFDCFVFPSIREGLGMALLEAQFRGLPCVYSDSIPHEVEVIPKIMLRLSLNLGPKKWAECILQFIKSTTRCPDYAESVMSNTSFNIRKNLQNLVSLYLDALIRNT